MSHHCLEQRSKPKPIILEFQRQAGSPCKESASFAHGANKLARNDKCQVAVLG